MSQVKHSALSVGLLVVGIWLYKTKGVFPMVVDIWSMYRVGGLIGLDEKRAMCSWGIYWVRCIRFHIAMGNLLCPVHNRSYDLA